MIIGYTLKKDLDLIHYVCFDCEGNIIDGGSFGSFEDIRNKYPEPITFIEVSGFEILHTNTVRDFSNPKLLYLFNVCPLCKEKTTFTYSVVNFSDGNAIGKGMEIKTCDSCGLIRKVKEDV